MILTLSLASADALPIVKPVRVIVTGVDAATVPL